MGRKEMKIMKRKEDRDKRLLLLFVYKMERREEEGAVTIDCYTFFFLCHSDSSNKRLQKNCTVHEKSQLQIKESAMSNISYLFGPIVVIVVVFAIVGCLLLFFVIRGNNAMHGHYSPSSHEFSQNRMTVSKIKRFELHIAGISRCQQW